MVSFITKFSAHIALRRTAPLALIATSLLFLCSHAMASNLTEDLGTPLGEQESKAVLIQLEGLQKDIYSFSARTRQKKRLTMLSEEIETEGHIILKRPNLMRWETVTPERIIATTDGETMTLFHVDSNRARSFDLSGNFSARHMMRFFALVMTSSFDGFSKDFFLTVFKAPHAIIVNIKPRSSIWAKYLGGMIIWYNVENGVPSKFAVDWKKRGEIETLFEEVEINPVLEEGVFDTSLPEGVTVTRSDFADDEME